MNLQNISISSGTLSDTDLVETFGAFYQLMTGDDTLLTEGRQLLLSKPNSEELSYFINEQLFDSLNELAPSGYYFGSHIGDGANFGYWEITLE